MSGENGWTVERGRNEERGGETKTILEKVFVLLVKIKISGTVEKSVCVSFYFIHYRVRYNPWPVRVMGKLKCMWGTFSAS